MSETKTKAKRGGSKAGGPQGAALSRQRALPKGQASAAARVRGPERAIVWWEGLTTLERGALVLEAWQQRGSPPAPTDTLLE